MIKVLTDQNFNGRILRGLVRRIPDLDLVRTEDLGLKKFTDSQLLAWAAGLDRVIFIHDESTFPKHAYKGLKNRKK